MKEETDRERYRKINQMKKNRQNDNRYKDRI
jgi:hypothetical protein